MRMTSKELAAMLTEQERWWSVKIQSFKSLELFCGMRDVTLVARPLHSAALSSTMERLRFGPKIKY
jgi:hypothetical protein